MSDYGSYDDSQFMYDLFTSPQYQDGGGMPGKTPAQKMAFLKSIQSLTGLPLTQLMGGGATQDQAAPFVNEYAQMYGNNPMYQEAFAAIDQGADPQTVMKNLLDNSKDYGFDGSDETAAARVFDTLQGYARDKVKETQYNLENQDPNRSFTLSNGKQYKGDPNIMGMASEYDLLGAPDPKELLVQYASERGAAQSRRATVNVLGKKVSGEVPDNENPVLATLGRLNRGQQNADGKPISAAQSAARNQAFTNRVDKSKNTMVRSDANSSAMRNLLAMRAFLGM